MSRKPESEPWSVPVRIGEVGRGPASRRLEPDADARARIAADLDLAGLPQFSAEVSVLPWEDGVEVRGRWSAQVVYTCGVTLEPYAQNLEGDFAVRAVPPDSPLAAAPETPSDEVDLDPDADDPPDVLGGDAVDLGAYLVEHLALELDPFPRKPGAVFEPPAMAEPESPFAVLKGLRKEP